MSTMLSKYFSMAEMTRTSNAALLSENLEKAKEYMEPLRHLAQLMDVIRDYVGYPIEIHSGFRCAALNGSTSGSSKTSQHMKGEACDFSPVGYDTAASMAVLFQKCQKVLEEKKLPFGQLIMESADRKYGVSLWIHLSLGQPYRMATKCGQVMVAKNGVFELLRKIPQPDQAGGY